MRIFEVKNNLVKVFYEAGDSLFLSGFVMIKDSRESYIGQIMHLESSKHGNVAIAKLIFNVTSDGVITAYSGSIPAINSAITNINSIDFLKLIQGQSPIIVGEFIENDLLVSLDKSLLENKLVVCSENQENSDLMIKTLNRQIKNYGKKTIIIDTDGESIFDKNAFIMGETFKLPINNQLINYIFENGLEYKSTRSKAVMQETLMELNYYISSLEEPFIPVEKFIDILEKQYNESKLPELVLLKNALVRYNESGYFAKNTEDYKNLLVSLLNNQTTVIDVSHVDESIQREVISYVYSLLKEIAENYYVFVKLTNGNSNKKLLKQVFSNKNTYTITTCSYTYKYLTELKKIAKDLILFTPLIQQQDFASYNTFLMTLGRTEFVVYGQATQYMPLIVKLSERAKIMSVAPQKTLTQEDAQKMVQQQLKEQQKRYEAEKEQQQVYNHQQKINQQMLQQQMSQMVYPQVMPMQNAPQVFYQQPAIYPQLQMFAPNPYMNIQAPYMPFAPQPYVQPQYVPQQFVTQPIQPQPQTLQNNTDIKENQEQKAPQEIVPPVFKSIEPQQMPIEQNVESKAVPKREEAENEIINVNDFKVENQLTEDDLDMIQDIDMYNSESESEDMAVVDEEQEQIISDFPELEPEPVDVSEDDSYLDEIHEDELPQEEMPSETEYIADNEPQDIKTKYNITEESLKEPETVPVYPANTGSNVVMNFEKGDTVVHEKFGSGRIEKIINYGSKKLCSVYFEGVGRRLLDPSLSEIKKVN